MHWFRTAFLWMLLIGGGATATAQEIPSAIRLGQPTPLPGVASQPRPRVVRGALPYLDDQPKSPEPKALPSLFPVAPGTGVQPVQAVQPEKDAPKVIEVDKEGKVTVVPEPPSFQPLKPKTLPAAVSAPPPPKVLDEHVIIVDDAGHPLWDGGPGAPARFYAQSEYLLWWTRGMHLPPLVLTDSPNTPLATRGILGNGTTQILYGNSDTSTGPTSGGRFTLGYALDPCGLCTLEGSFFFLGRNNTNANFNSNQFPVLGRPFIDLNDGIVNRELTTSPNQPGAVFAATGAINVATTSNLLGAEANVKSLLWCGCNFEINGLVGFRFLDLSESVRINETSLQQIAFADTPFSIRPGDTTSVFDNFGTHNRFYGGQVGASGEWFFGRWSVEGSVKLAIGVTQQIVNVDGGQRDVSLDGRVQTAVGGLYAVSSNIGSHAQNQFGFVPELGLKLNYQLTEHISVFAGYDFLYWSSVVRPGDQIDQVLDLNRVPNSGGPYPPANQVRPVVPFQVSSYWAQGVNAGVLIRY
jgi:hypothetical protein